MSKKYFDKELDAWKILHGPEGPELQKRYRSFFKNAFPDGHKTSIRPVIRECARHPEELQSIKSAHFLRSVHPSAFKLIARYGCDYRPRRWKEPPGREPMVAGCFINAWRMMRSHNYALQKQEGRKSHRSMVYVEGIAIGAVVEPMHHAWNALGIGGTTAIDWTHYAGCHWSRYIGIPFSEEEYCEIMDMLYPRKRRINMIFRNHVFPEVEEHLRKLLAHRTAQKRARAA